MDSDIDSGREDFEKFCTSKGMHKEYTKWNPELNRYTCLSTKQLLWEAWNVSRGIPYVYTHGYGIKDGYQ